ncbi:NAD-glutamate dehydrogenase [Ilumatobacter nonamiensis]|uniref:NAD-glutamate dehydrogenase n=1 Tax=Ilumatobacter nonamiensis TaxID=467093 RepID=UPI00058B6209|nr:NAD-glutamate dehydrogenase [Ilumatobacter nonamiensis]
MVTEREEATTLEALASLAAERHPDDPLLARFLRHYYRQVSDADAGGRRVEDIYAAGLAHLRLGRTRPSHDVQVEVLSPDFERDGWQTDRSILLFVTDDIPFLVDTVRIVLERFELGIHLLVHPMLSVDRDATGTLTGVEASAGNGDPGLSTHAAGDHAGERIEAWTQIEFDRCRSSVRRELEDAVRSAIADVQQIVADFVPMRDRLAGVADGDPLLDWLADPHFVFLGAASYQRTPDGLILDPDSVLGTFRSTGHLDPNVVDPPSMEGDQRFVIARTNAVSVIHRPVRMTALAIRPEGTDITHRFVGLLGSGAYRDSVFAIPVVSDRAREVMHLTGVSARSFLGRAVKNTLETLPRDLMFELDSHRLAELVIGIVGIQERRIVRVFDVAEPVGPFTTVLVHVPRVRFNAGLPDTVAEILGEHYSGEVRDVETTLDSSSLARVSATVRAENGAVDLERLAERIDIQTRSWNERVELALIDGFGDEKGRQIFATVKESVPSDYRARTRPESAISDLARVAQHLRTPAGEVRVTTSFGRSLDAPDDVIRFRIFLTGRDATMSELVPILDHLGMHALEERPSEFRGPHGTTYFYDIDVRLDVGRIDDDQANEVEQTFVGLAAGTIESDGLNRLVLSAGLSIRQVAVLRLYHRYLRQGGLAFSRSYIERTLTSQPEIAALFVELFTAKFDPTGTVSAEEREREVAAVSKRLGRALDEVPSLDDDRICRAFLTLIEATVRTNAFSDSDEIAVKLRPSEISFLPEPRPAFEIFVSSAWVEGVHLRAGPIARGGLRWSDRPEDFRTEVLGLVKAQMVKNAVIVPVGAKGGFVVRRSQAAPGDRDAFRAEGIDRYRRFITALLSITDNVVDGDVVSPPNCVVHDGPDPYLVVAADKGTATFSDIANEIAVERGFWLGDAFASGGSNGYDHKAIGITARGAWESVRRHARVLGKNLATDEFTVVGIGDMSGDVFGNGMLLSPHLRIVAAFDHRHILLDPDPDPAVSFAERSRLFDLARSSWADYDETLISDGGGVFARSLKAITLTDAVRRSLGIDPSVSQLRPDDVISAILRAPVDLLWNGGIGTYVKASTETHEQVGDRANDPVRVDAVDLRCAMVGEGGNLGLTQLGRVEFAATGGLIATDAIDNSAGVDCSDHEVNIKIALDQLVHAGDLTVKQRNELLAEMTDDVAELVLDDNRAQTLALMIARRQAHPMVNVHARYLDALESDGLIDRSLEFLPSDKALAERQANGQGMLTPEFAVMIAYTKQVDVQEILDSDLPDDPALDADLLAYFPLALRERYPDRLREHRLRREIVATSVVNSMVNLSGISFDHRMTEGTGATVTDVARAFIVAREVTQFAEQWSEIDTLVDLDPDAQVDLFLDLRRMAERCATWLLRNRRPPLDIAGAIGAFRTDIRTLSTAMVDTATGRVHDDIVELRQQHIEQGVPPELAARASQWPWLHTGFDIVEVARPRACDVLEAARTYWAVFEALDLAWLWDGIGALPRSDRWQTQGRAALRDDLLAVLASLTGHVLDTAGGDPHAWIEANGRPATRALGMHTEIRRADSFDLTTLSVALRQLRNLTLTAVGSD